MEAKGSAFAADVARVRRFKRYLWHEPNPLIQIFYLLLVVGGYGAFLFAGLPLLPNAFLGEVHILLSFAAVLLALHSFIAASTTSPGILTPQTIPLYDNYALDGELYATPRRECITCKTAKLARSKHCSVCDLCVPRFDHHCVWLNACIGERNHRHFLYFLVANIVLCAYGSFVLFFILYDQFLTLRSEQFVDDETGQVIQGVTVVVLRYLVHAESPLFVLWVLCTLMGLAVVGFFVFHCYLVATNTTTNEFFKWRAIRSSAAKKRKRPIAREDPVESPPMRHIYGLGSVVENVREVLWPRCDQRLEEYLRRLAKPVQHKE